jgi:hypothetical protein
MALEERNGRLVYYRKVRRGRRVSSEYCASGEAALLVARLDALRREERAAGRRAEAARRRRMAEDEAAERAAFGRVRLLTKAALLAAGCHQHAGAWRRARNYGRGERESGG